MAYMESCNVETRFQQVDVESCTCTDRCCTMQHLPLVFYIDLLVLVILSASLSCLFSALEKYHKAAEAAQSAFAEFESKDVRLQEVIILWEVFFFFHLPLV